MPKGKYPDYKGKVCDEERNAIGEIALWIQQPDEKKSEKSPAIRGTIKFVQGNPLVKDELAGTKIRVALWTAERKADQDVVAADAAGEAKNEKE